MLSRAKATRLSLSLNGGVVKNNTSGDNRDIPNCGILNDNGSDITPATCEDVSDGSTTGVRAPLRDSLPASAAGGRTAAAA